MWAIPFDDGIIACNVLLYYQDFLFLHAHVLLCEGLVDNGPSGQMESVNLLQMENTKS